MTDCLLLVKSCEEQASWQENGSLHNKQIGILDICHLGKNPESEIAFFLEEEKSLIGAIAESISRIVEREWAEAEIRKCRVKIEKLIKQTE